MDESAEKTRTVGTYLDILWVRGSLGDRVDGWRSDCFLQILLMQNTSGEVEQQ